MLASADSRMTQRNSVSAVAPAETIVCVDCGGKCHRLGYPPELGWQEGDVVVYRCEDCLDAWYLEISEADLGQ